VAPYGEKQRRRRSTGPDPPAGKGQSLRIHRTRRSSNRVN